jgi:hypothetical protein
MVAKALDRPSKYCQKPRHFVQFLQPSRGIALALRTGLRAVATVATIRGEE